MAYELKGFAISLRAASPVTLATTLYAPVNITANDTFSLATAGGRAIGFIQTECRIGEAGQVLIEGVTFARAAGTIAAGAFVEANGTGGVVTRSTGQAVGIALQAGNNGDMISVLITPARV